MFTCEPSSCALDIELTLPDRDSTFIDVKENDTVDDVKRQLLSECYGFDASPYYPTEKMVLRFGVDVMANDVTVGEKGYGLQSGAKLSFEAGDDFNECGWLEHGLSELDDSNGWDFFPAIVVDNGSGMIKAGCSGEDAPKVTFPRLSVIIITIITELYSAPATVKRITTSVRRPNKSEASYNSSTQLNTELCRTGTTWKRFGITPLTTSCA